VSRWPIRATAVAFAGILFALVASAVPAASSDGCGQVVTADLVLAHDLVCSSSGLLIRANGVTVNLNDHSIIGPGPVLSSTGISVGAFTSIEIIGPGTIRNFRTGIALAGSSDVLITGVTIRDNGWAMQPGSSAGIRIVGSHGVAIEGNVIKGNQDAGIDIVASTGVAIAGNNIKKNAAGIYFVDTASTGNTVIGNKISENDIGIRGSIVGNTITGNRFKRNGMDFAP